MAVAEIGVATDLSALDALINGLESRAQAVVERYAALIVEEAQRLAPVRTGELRASLHAEVSAMMAEIVSDTNHSSYVEYGTARAPSQPFLRPAVERHRESFLREIEEIFG